ncbi:MAG: cytochrome c [Pseudomonadota bacterium]
MRNTIIIVIAAALVVMVYRFFQPAADDRLATGSVSATAMVDVTLAGDLSADAVAGKRLFEASCAACHGENAAGQADVAPPLIHKIYEPSHHGDESFQRAVAMGVRAHHWRFGNMPAVEGLNRNDVAKIVTYVRELQRANGIN